MSLGGSFLFAEEEEGEISSERLLAGHSVLPLHNHRNPGSSGEALCTPNVCRCRYPSMQKQKKKDVMDKAEHANPNTDRSLIQQGMCVSGWLRNTHTYTPMSVFCITPSQILIYCGEENYEYSSCLDSPGLEFFGMSL